MKNLQNIRVNLEKGQTLGIVGKTGVWENNFYEAIIKGISDWCRSALTIGETAISEQTKDQVLEWIGYVPQDHVLFSRTIRQNILFGKEDATEEELEEAIRLAHFQQDLMNLPMGLRNISWGKRCFLIWWSKATCVDCTSAY